MMEVEVFYTDQREPEVFAFVESFDDTTYPFLISIKTFNPVNREVEDFRINRDAVDMVVVRFERGIDD